MIVMPYSIKKFRYHFGVIAKSGNPIRSRQKALGGPVVRDNDIKSD